MTAVNLVNNHVLTKMREDILLYKKQLRHLKTVYSAECVTNQKLMTECVKSREENNSLRKMISRLEHEFNNKFSDYYDDTRPKRKRKSWNERTKRRRFLYYKGLILLTLKEINGCHRSEVTLWLGDNKLNFLYSPKDFERNEGTDLHVIEQIKRTEHILQEHNYSDCVKEIEHDNDLPDTEYTQIYDAEGNWQKKHIRKLIHVLDSFRISHEGYHELRMVSKGHLPPIWRLMVEKKYMSEEIPYIKHPKVGFKTKYCFFCSNLNNIIYISCLITQTFNLNRRMQSGEVSSVI